METGAGTGAERAQPESPGEPRDEAGADRAGLDSALAARLTELSPLLLYDGECGLCARSVRFLLDRDKKKRLRFAPLQSEVGRGVAAAQGLDPSEPTTIVLVEESGRVSLRSTAALRSCAELRMPWRFGTVFLIVPRFLRDAVYRWISKRRLRWFGTADSCRLPSKEEQARFVA